jgi:hypothetical protein
MNNHTLVAMAVLMPIVVGCATPMATNTRAEVGAMPQHYEEAIREQLRLTLNDPASVQDFRAGPPKLSSCMIGPGQLFYGWRVIAHYSAKNLYGAYVGLRQQVYWFHGERIALVSLDTVRCPEGWKKT